MLQNSLSSSESAYGTPRPTLRRECMQSTAHAKTNSASQGLQSSTTLTQSTTLYTRCARTRHATALDSRDFTTDISRSNLDLPTKKGLRNYAGPFLILYYPPAQTGLSANPNPRQKRHLKYHPAHQSQAHPTGSPSAGGPSWSDAPFPCHASGKMSPQEHAIWQVHQPE